MKQYMLSVPDDRGRTAPARRRSSRRPYEQTAGLQRGDAGRRRVGVRRRALPASSATVLRPTDGDGLLVTDGPFTEAKEHIGGFWVIAAPDLDAALDWAKKAAAACGEPVEVRPFQDEPPV